MPAITFGETACWRRPAATNRDPLESKAPLVEHLLLVDHAEASWFKPHELGATRLPMRSVIPACSVKKISKTRGSRGREGHISKLQVRNIWSFLESVRRTSSSTERGSPPCRPQATVDQSAQREFQKNIASGLGTHSGVANPADGTSRRPMECQRNQPPASVPNRPIKPSRSYIKGARFPCAGR